MQPCDVCGNGADASVCDKCAREINHRVETDEHGTPHDWDRITPDPEYVEYFRQHGHYPSEPL